MKPIRQPGKSDVLLTVSSWFLPAYFSFLFSRDPFAKNSGRNGKGEEQGNKASQGEACLSVAYARIGRDPSPFR